MSELARPAAIHPAAAVAADAAAEAGVFARYHTRISPQTRRRQRADLVRFANYLAAVGATDDAEALAAALRHEPAAWANLSWGLIAGFVEWMLQQGDALGSIAVRLATVRRFARLAAQAGAIDETTLALIRTVQAPSGHAARTLDRERPTTRRGPKKAQPILLAPRTVRQLKRQPETAQGRRDGLLLCLLLDHGLRIGELAALRVGAIDLERGTITFERPKVNLTQTHRLSAEALVAAGAYLRHERAGAAPDAPLWLGSRKGGKRGRRAGELVGTMSDRAIRARVGWLGAQVGVKHLSPHDCRHTWATRAQQGGTSAFALRDAGGWSSLAMPSRYAHANAIANEGVVLSEG